GDVGAGPLGAHLIAECVAEGLREQESGDDEGHGHGDRDRGREESPGGAAEGGPGDADHRAPPSCVVAACVVAEWEAPEAEAAAFEPRVVAVTFISAVATDSGSGWVSSPASRPSASSTTRSARAAARGSWVTMTTVWPSSSTEDRRMLSTSSPAFESRLPVG